MDILDQVKSFVIGIAFPAFLLCLAGFYLAGQDTRSAGLPLTPSQSFGVGLFYLGCALCAHGWGFRAYDNHPAVRCALCALGVISLIVGFCFRVHLA